ncbi:MAG: hypothetical protein JWM74_5339 [Myxococcaceae bacterium]|nr:hypothetical protein [Myxococcaceae bacterium]
MSERMFHVLVVTALLPRADHATSSGHHEAFQDPIRFERATFDEAMALVGPELAIDVPDPAAPHGKPIRVDVAFKAMRSFRPDALLEDVALLRELCAAYVPPPRARGGSLVEDILSGMGPASALPTDRTAALLGAIVHHPEIRRLERAWRGLHFLASRADRDKVVIDAVHAHAEDVEATLDRLARKTDLDAFDLVVVDHTLGSSARDLARIESWASLAERIGVPLVTNGSPELVGEDDLAMLGRTQRRLRASDDPRAVAVRSLAAKDATRWIALAMNGAVARPRHAGAVKRTNGLIFDEQEELVMGAAYLVATLACEAFAKTGWACALTGPAHGIVRGLPVRSLDDRGSEVQTPLEALATDPTAAEAAAAGIILFASAANKDVAILTRASMLHSATSTSGGMAAAASLGLADQLFVARVAHAVVQLAAAIPGETPPAAACDVARLALADLFGVDAASRPSIDVTIAGSPPTLEVTVKPRGFFDVRLEEATLAARLA